MRSGPWGGTSEQVAYGDVNGRLPWAYARPRGGLLGAGKDGAQEFRHSWNVPKVPVQSSRQIEGAASRNQPKFRHVITNNTGNLIEYSTRCSRQRIASHSPNRRSANS